MTNAIVQVRNITKQYRGSHHPAVSDLSLEITEGSVFGLLGPNGAGKSTLVMMMCGLLAPDDGSISLFGMNVRNKGVAIRTQVGVAPQEIALFPTLTAYENLFYFGRMYGLDGAVIKDRIDTYLTTFDLKEKANDRVQTFSGGMKRRLNLIAALLHQPKLIILDEPTSGVDVQSRNVILDFLVDLATKKTTIIYSSHFLAEAERICTHLAILDAGKLIVAGTPDQVMEKNLGNDNLEQVFLTLTGKNIRD
jgi:ABC-2 type transport system ATP-binding protein